MHSTDSQENLTESAPVRKHAGRFGPMFRHIVPIAILFMFPAIFTSSLNWERRFVADPDIWWHLADARQIFTSHQFLRTETTSFTVAGKPWVDPEWLSEIPYWAGYRALGLRGVYLTTWLVLSANLLLFYWRGLWRTGHAGAALLASSLGLVLLTVNSGPRTIAIAYLAMASELMILERAEAGKKGLLWLLPLLFCVWANLHGSWLIGIGLLVLYIVCGWFGIGNVPVYLNIRIVAFAGRVGGLLSRHLTAYVHHRASQTGRWRCDQTVNLREKPQSWPDEEEPPRLYPFYSMILARVSGQTAECPGM